jgi:hypothetical protein
MGDTSDPKVGATARDAKDDKIASRNWVIPVVTALILALAFCFYYFVYVAARREYLVNRNFRALAALGDHIQRILSTHGSILEFYADLADTRRLPKRDRERENLSKFLIVHPEDTDLDAKARDLESRRDYLHYLAPTFDLVERPIAASKPPPRLEAQRRDGRWYLTLSAVRHREAATDYLGSLETRDVLEAPAGALPFDDILLVSENGSVVYQARNAGPQFTTLASLLKARIGGTADNTGAPEEPPQPGAGAESKEGQPDEKSRPAGTNSQSSWEAGAIHLTDVLLAGTRYKLFLQPILIDIFTDDPTQAEPAREWVLCGLRSASALEWESLSISYTVIIAFTALFLAICMGGPLLKVIFINHRERFRLRELGLLSLFLVLLAAVFTLSGLQLTEFQMNGGAEAQLRSLSEALSTNIHDDLSQMRRQLKQWCESPALRTDLKLAEKTEVIRNTPDSLISKVIEQTPPPAVYAFVNNAFWTDDNGQQIVKWSTSGYVTPMIDLSKQRLYTSPKRTYLDGTGPPVYFASTLPPNKMEYLAAIGINTEDCNPALKDSSIRGDVTGGSAFLTGQPFSLIDPILPFGYGFALIDDTGSVLFHADRTKNGRENFREESEWNREMYAAMFGHSSGHSLRIRYLGKDYRAMVVPIPGVTQANWSLIVYTDLNEERTLALQTMAMAATLTLWILAGPALAVAIWALVRRPRFAPEWLWPNRRRLPCYWYQICLYLLLIVVFLFVGFRGPIEQIVVACAAIPYTGLLLTFWCFRRYPSHPEAWRVRNGKESGALPALVTVVSTAAFAWVLVFHWSHLKALAVLPPLVAVAIVPLLDRPRLYIARMSSRRQRLQMAELESGEWRRTGWAYTHAYAASVILLLLLFGVLMPMALFRGCLAVERRLAVKQEQIHLATDLVARRAETQDKCEAGDIGVAACEQFKRDDSLAWKKIVLASSLPGNSRPAIEPHRAPSGPELYEDWFRGLIYLLHHDYNSTAAETLGLIADGVSSRDGSRSPEWSWENSGTSVTLRWHGIHLPNGAAPDRENDLVVRSEAPSSPRYAALSGFGIAAVVMLVIGGLFWMLVRKVLLIHLAPLKMTGLREVAESLRLGRNILVIAPPFSEFEVESAVETLDLKTMSSEARMAENVNLEALPSKGIIAIRHFEYESDVVTTDEKLALLNRLMQKKDRQIAVVMYVPASTEDYRRLFPQLTVIDLREEPFPWLKQYGGPARELIWAECQPISALWPLGAQLAKDLGSETVHSWDTVASEILERADPYYRLVWSECSNEQRFVLSQLAEDGLLNPMNGRAIRQLVRRGLIVQDPQFRIMNESFRRFLRSVTTSQMKEQWLIESRRSGWGKMHGAFFTTMIVLGVFLLTTQNALWQSSAAYVTTAFAALGTLAKLFNSFRGTTSGEKAN